MLLAAGAKGMFFWNGNNCTLPFYLTSSPSQSHPPVSHRQLHLFSRKHQTGPIHLHMVASHTWAHKNLSTLTAKELDSEMGLVDEALECIIGVKPAFRRPPYGSYNDLVRKVAQGHGQRLAIWDFDSGNSIGLNAS
jgi:peptidoglycan/xylan/chitin deacetylase (PgdA/CDA1 family)